MSFLSHVFCQIVSFFFQQNCCISRMVKLHGDLKNKKPCITMTKESVTGLISITKTLSIPCCSTLFSRFLCHHFTTFKCCQTSSECRCDHGFSLQEHLRILASSKRVTCVSVFVRNTHGEVLLGINYICLLLTLTMQSLSFKRTVFGRV